MFKCFLIQKIKLSSILSLTLLFSCLASECRADSDRILIPDSRIKVEKWLHIIQAPESAEQISFEEYCAGGKQVKAVREHFSVTLPDQASGIPKDIALTNRTKKIAHLRKVVSGWFQPEVHPTPLKIQQEYTLFIPPKCSDEPNPKHRACYVWKVAFVKQKCKMEDEDKCTWTPSPSQAVSYKDELWQKYFQIYTTVKESPSADGKTFNFEVSLDLSQACKFARPLKDLVTD